MNSRQEELEVESGRSISLRLIEEKDAEFVVGLRTDPSLNMHLSTVSADIQAQKEWIRAYKDMERQRTELYYIVERMDGVKCGTVRLYNITKEQFTWGSWVLNSDKPYRAALESALLVYKIGFCTLKKLKSEFEVRKDNTHTVSFHKKFGAKFLYEDDTNMYFEYPREQFLQDHQRYMKILGIEGEIDLGR